MTILIEILPIICGICVSLMLHQFDFNQTYKHAAWSVLSLVLGIAINQITGEPALFIIFDMVYIALSASITTLLVRKITENMS